MKNKLLFYKNNLLVQISVISMAKINALLSKPFYSPDLDPSFFPSKQKEILGGKKFTNNQKVVHLSYICIHTLSEKYTQKILN